MKIDSHVLFLIIVIGVISAGIVGATVMNTDASLKQEVFDGITVAVPVDSEFVKVDDGVYKDANYGIKINTFKNNDSMIDFLKSSKKSKIIPIDDQPPQSVAFKKGDTINILVTNGNEGISVGSKDGELTSKIANNVIFSNNHKAQKPMGLPFAKQPMKVERDFNMIMLLVAQVDTKVFNVDMLQNNLIVVADDYNDQLSQPVDDAGFNSEEDMGEVSDISNQEDLNNALTDGDNATTTATTPASNDDSQNAQPSSDNSNSNDDAAQTTVVSSNEAPSSDSGSAAGGDTVDANPVDSSSNAQSAPVDTSQPSGSSGSSSQQQELSVDQCKELVTKQLLMNHPELMIDSKYDEVTDGYCFTIVDSTNNKIGTVTVNALTGNIDPDSQLRQAL